MEECTIGFKAARGRSFEVAEGPVAGRGSLRSLETKRRHYVTIVETSESPIGYLNLAVPQGAKEIITTTM